MEAVAVLYSEGDSEVATAILSSLGKAVFESPEPEPVGLGPRLLSRFSYWGLQRTTTRLDTGRSAGEQIGYRNPIMERSGHPYARSLLAASSRETEGLVEGGDPMNGQYMVIAPEIRRACSWWDLVFFYSLQGRSVQQRLIWETQATHAEAKARLDKTGRVRLKALAAGTGLSMILAYDRLLRDGYDPGQITIRITDRDPANSAKTGRLLAKLATSRGWQLGTHEAVGISASTEDIFEGDPQANPRGEASYDVVTAVGILEYLQGFTSETTEQRLSLPESEEPVTAMLLAEKLHAITHEDAALIVNTNRSHASSRILELFGKKFDFRGVPHLSALLATANFNLVRLAGSELIYDVAIYGKTQSLTK